MTQSLRLYCATDSDADSRGSGPGPQPGTRRLVTRSLRLTPSRSGISASAQAESESDGAAGPGPPGRKHNSRGRTLEAESASNYASNCVPFEGTWRGPLSDLNTGRVTDRVTVTQ